MIFKKVTYSYSGLSYSVQQERLEPLKRAISNESWCDVQREFQILKENASDVDELKVALSECIHYTRERMDWNRSLDTRHVPNMRKIGYIMTWLGVGGAMLSSYFFSRSQTFSMAGESFSLALITVGLNGSMTPSSEESLGGLMHILEYFVDEILHIPVDQ